MVFGRRFDAEAHGRLGVGHGRAVMKRVVLRRMRRGLAARRATEAPVGTSFLVPLAEVYGNMGQTEDALTVLAEVRATASMDKAELHRLQGELLPTWAFPDASQAETSFLKALDIARSQQAKSWELRAATSLARWWQYQGKRQEAYNLLALVYGWFTEGFDTADLKDARTLLQELGG